MRILVTGASGFVGASLCSRLRRDGHDVVAAVRDKDSLPAADGLTVKAIGDIGASPSWDDPLSGVDAVVHLAAMVHQMGKVVPSAAEYTRVNAAATEDLAAACIRNGVRRLVFLSSVKVNGECSGPVSYTEADTPRPEDPYGLSKLQAERSLASLGSQGRLETVIVRPPLVYGPGVRANFLRLIGIVDRMNPAVVPALVSKRSFVGLGNLADVLTLCTAHPGAAGQTFLVSDGEDVTAAELMRRLATAMGRRSYVVPVTEAPLRFAARLLGKEQVVKRIVDPLTVSTAHVRSRLGWTPPFSLDAGLDLTLQWYRTAAR